MLENEENLNIENKEIKENLDEKSKLDKLLEEADDDLFEESQETGDSKPDFHITSSKDSAKLNKKLGSLKRNGIPLNIALIVLAVIAIASFGIFVGLYLINNYNDTTKLVTEIDGMERLFYEVKKLSFVKNETIQFLKSRAETEEILSAFNESSSSGVYKNLKIVGPSQKVVDLLKKTIDDNRIIINKLELRSNLGFPILPRTSLSSNIVVELEMDLSVSNLF